MRISFGLSGAWCSPSSPRDARASADDDDDNLGVIDTHCLRSSHLTLLKVDIDLDIHADSLCQLVIKEDGIRMLDWKRISMFWPKQPADDRLHIFVRLPATTVQIATAINDYVNLHALPQCPVIDVLDLWRINRFTTVLPSVEELRALLEKPLTDSEKVPIQQENKRDLDTLFMIGVEVPALSIIFTAASRPPPSNGTECAFVSFWDDNIRKIIELLIPNGTSIRNDNQHTETRNLRPSFGFLLGTACPLRGEEKGPGDVADPRAELVDKLKADEFGWVYNPAPFMLGYYCRGSEMTLCAILVPDTPRSKARIFDIVTVDLRFRKSRIANIRYLINLSSLFPVLASLVPFSVSEFEVIDKMHSTVELTATSVIKTFKHHSAWTKVKHLETIYNLIEIHSIPNTDTLVMTKGGMVCLSPRGIASRPRHEKKLRECLICVLEALVVAHQIPLYHRDIRWDNINKSRR
ncbi:hypothetical protein AX14_001918 [Amanita brunnescens Koide BX004]|nr:hypothetical protein AX14_001918 [Amanita brunnescens Koide BX004]